MKKSNNKISYDLQDAVSALDTWYWRPYLLVSSSPLRSLKNKEGWGWFTAVSQFWYPLCLLRVLSCNCHRFCVAAFFCKSEIFPCVTREQTSLKWHFLCCVVNFVSHFPSPRKNFSSVTTPLQTPSATLKSSVTSYRALIFPCTLGGNWFVQTRTDPPPTTCRSTTFFQPNLNRS